MVMDGIFFITMVMEFYFILMLIDGFFTSIIMDGLKNNLDGHRLSDLSEGALVSSAKGGWMDGLRSSILFLLAKCRQKEK